MLVRVRERNDRLQASVQQASLVQAADGTISHEQFAIPTWLTQAVRDNAGVSVTRVDSGNTNSGASPPNGLGRDDASARGVSTPPNAPTQPESQLKKAPSGSGGNGAAAAVLEPEPVATIVAPTPAPTTNGNGTAHRKLLRFYLHESAQPDDDLARIDTLIDLLKEHPGHDAVRIFIHAHDGDRIELSLPDADVTDDLRVAGVRLLGDGGGAEPIVSPKRKAAAV